MPVAEVVHAAPVGGLSFTPCYDRTLLELPPHQRVSHRADEVTCNRLTAEDELLLTGAGAAAGAEAPGGDQLLYQIAVSVRSLHGPGISLSRAFQCVRTAAAELAPPSAPNDRWPAELLVDITTRAGELARPA